MSRERSAQTEHVQRQHKRSHCPVSQLLAQAENSRCWSGVPQTLQLAICAAMLPMTYIILAVRPVICAAQVEYKEAKVQAGYYPFYSSGYSW